MYIYVLDLDSVTNFFSSRLVSKMSHGFLFPEQKLVSSNFSTNQYHVIRNAAAANVLLSVLPRAPLPIQLEALTNLTKLCELSMVRIYLPRFLVITRQPILSAKLSRLMRKWCSTTCS